MTKKYIIVCGYSNLHPPFSIRLATYRVAYATVKGIEDGFYRDDPSRPHVYKVSGSQLVQCFKTSDM